MDTIEGKKEEKQENIVCRKGKEGKKLNAIGMRDQGAQKKLCIPPPTEGM